MGIYGTITIHHASQPDLTVLRWIVKLPAVLCIVLSVREIDTFSSTTN